MRNTTITLGGSSNATGRLSSDDALDFYGRTQSAVKTSDSKSFKEDFNSLAVAIILGVVALILFYNKK